MSLPPLAPIPPANIRLNLGPEEWEACLDAWLSLGELMLRLPLASFKTATSSGSALPLFLTGFYREHASSAPSDMSLKRTKAHVLRRTCFLLAHRTLLETEPVPTMLQWGFLADFSYIHMRSQALSSLLRILWMPTGAQLEASLQEVKDSLVSTLDSPTPEAAEQTLKRLATLLYASPHAGAFFMTGSDLLDALAVAYVKVSVAVKARLITFAYLGLLSLTRDENANASMLSDHLYSLKGPTDSATRSPLLLGDLINHTPLLARIRALDRLHKLGDSLSALRRSDSVRRKTLVKRRIDKGKAMDTHGKVNGEFHIHRMSLVTQVQDLFPELGSGYVLKLLDEYNDDVEQVTAHLLDNSLSPHLSGLDRSEETALFNATTEQEQINHLTPRSTPPPSIQPLPQRRNVFDDDELDRLEIDTSRLHLGKKDRQTATSKDAPNKAAILSALAAFDSDDDERDDTYDVEDVGGTVDTAHPDGEPGQQVKAKQEENDEALFQIYNASPGLFGRTFDVRRGQARAALKSETGMTDEAIEGWAIMLQRDPKRLKRLEAQQGTFDGKQTELAGTAYRESPAGTETEDSDAPGGSGNREGCNDRGRGRGRGGRGRGRGGRAAGPSGDVSTVAAQRRKEANKGSRANHNRRDQRARKMARGGFPG